MKIEGLDNLEKSLNELSANAKKLSGTSAIPFDELFPPSFMRHHTDSSSIDEFLDNSPFTIESEEDFLAIPDEEWDNYIVAHTDFSSWEEMQGKAAEDYVVKQLGF
ncbi:hypothetical protein [uncultured Veillonella sp.]|uniref:hypothetical protein n=1 Tax=uncultured Veillonella sp. TaxID=159268 RepID=UPI002604870C|nr:hypothetical protein [uncultured Veillonella sp.]